MMSTSTSRPSGKKSKRSRVARSNWLYTEKDVQTLYGVCRNTVLNWMKYGLRSIETERRLFLGAELNSFHSMRKRQVKSPCGLFEIHCTSCKGKHSLLIEPFDVAEAGRSRTRVSLTCPETGGKASSFLRETDLEELRHHLESKLSAETPV